MSLTPGLEEAEGRGAVAEGGAVGFTAPASRGTVCSKGRVCVEMMAAEVSGFVVEVGDRGSRGSRRSLFEVVAEVCLPNSISAKGLRLLRRDGAATID